MTNDRQTTAAFTGHRTYADDVPEALRANLDLLYARGIRTFLCGMAVGFDLAAAEAVLVRRALQPDIRLVAVVPFEGQEKRFSEADRVRYGRILGLTDATIVLSQAYHRGCYAVRNDYLIDHASVLIAWYDGSAGGTHYTVQRALRRHLEIVNLHPASPFLPQPVPVLF